MLHHGGATSLSLNGLWDCARGSQDARPGMSFLLMIIDCHGHYTTAPKSHGQWSEECQDLVHGGGAFPAYPEISDDEIRETLELHQLQLIRERGITRTMFSPRASAMAHDINDQRFSEAWARACNDLIGRVRDLYPEVFTPVCQLPQSPGGSLAMSVRELERCVLDLGFVGCNINPDPSGGEWSSPAMTDRYWYPLYEKMVELGVPGMIHVSRSTKAVFHTTGAHYINADTAVFMQLVQGDLFRDFPSLTLVIPHGGGAVPYHWGRYRGLADMLNKPSLKEHLLNNVCFDTCVYHQPGIDLLLSVVPHSNILFGSEMLGAVRGRDAISGNYFDDVRRYVDSVGLEPRALSQVFSVNARRVYPRLDAQLARLGI